MATIKASRLVVLGACLLAMTGCARQSTAGVISLHRFGSFHQSFRSIGAQDGWVVGTGQYDDMGVESDASGTGLRVGDENGYGAHQIRSILSFDTSPLPDDAIVTGVSLILKQESIVIGGGNPFQDFRGLLIDIKWGSFGRPALEVGDFQAASDVSGVGPYKPELSDTYTFPLGEASYAYINKWPVSGGLTQLRLRFRLDSDLNARPNYIHFYSGNVPEEELRPELVITYYRPSQIEMGWVGDGG